MKRYLFNLATDKSKGLTAEGIKVFLLLLSLLYGLIVRILIWIRQIRTYQSECKVISIGNITLGGTGKTVVVEYIARYLNNKGKKLAILSRGYKRRVVTTSQSQSVTSYEMLGDEPYMLSRNLGDIPIIVNSDRIKAAQDAIKNHRVDTVLLDDGFQQWHIKKDLEVVTIDSINPFGNRHMIPRGILREPLSCLRRADVLILTKSDLATGVQEIRELLSRINPKALILESVHKPFGFYKLGFKDGLLDMNVLKDKVVTLISGIGDPDSFESLIRSMGIEIGLSFRFPDHHHYNKEDLDKIIKESQVKPVDAIVVTEKDAARISNLACINYQLPIFVLRIELRIIKDETKLHNRLLQLYTS